MPQKSLISLYANYNDTSFINSQILTRKPAKFAEWEIVVHFFTCEVLLFYFSAD